jgi:hypothetical protein
VITHGKDGTWIAECDGCPDAKVNTGQRLFHQAVNYVRGAEGWKIRYIGDQWWAICPRCADVAHGLTPDDLAIPIFDDSRWT